MQNTEEGKNIVLLSTGLCMIQNTVRQDMPTDAIVSRLFMKIPTITSMTELMSFPKEKFQTW